MGFLVLRNDPALVEAIESSLSGASRTAWVRAMNRLDIPVLPHIVNAVTVNSIFSAGNAFVFARARLLQAMALEGMLCKVFAMTDRHKTSYISFKVTTAIDLLSFL